MNIEQANAAYAEASRRVRKASRKYDRYRAFFGYWHNSTRKAWTELTEAWRVSDQAWQEYTEAHRAHISAQFARLEELSAAWR